MSSLEKNVVRFLAPPGKVEKQHSSVYSGEKNRPFHGRKKEIREA
jgi:hypothetical protein